MTTEREAVRNSRGRVLPFLVTLVLILILSCFLSCGPPETPAPEEATSPPSPAVTGPTDGTSPDLADCPRGDAPWSDALRQAGQQRDFTAVMEASQAASERCPDHWEPRWTLAECLYRTGKGSAAVSTMNHALNLAEKSGHPAGVALAGYRLAWLATREGSLEEGERLYRLAVKAVEQTGRDDLRAQVLNGFAGLLVETGRFSEANLTLRQTAGALEKLGMAPYARRLTVNRAVLLMLLGDGFGSEQLLELAYRQAADAGDGYVLPRAALSLANLHRRMNRAPQATEWYRKVPVDDPELSALAALGEGVLEMRAGRIENARALFKKAATRDDPVDQLLIEAYSAEADLAAGDPLAAMRRASTAALRADGIEAVNVAWIARWIAGRAAFEAGDPARATTLLREAVAILDRQQDALHPLQEGLRYLRERSDVYIDLAAVLCTGGNLPDTLATILATLEKTHAMALRRTWRGGGSYPTPDLAALQAGLRSGEILLDYGIGRERGVLLAVSNREARAVQIPGWDRLVHPLRKYRSALSRPLRSAEARLDPMADLARSAHYGEILAGAFLEPVRDMLVGARRLYIVPDREMALMPFDALPWNPGSEPGSFLANSMTTAILPLAAVPWTGSALTDIGRDGGVLLAGDPDPGEGENLPRLPSAAREITELRKVWNDRTVTVITGGDLRREILLAALDRRPGIIHLATHAIASTSDPERCAVHLSLGDRLGLDDISDLKLGGSHVMLSACSTGEGEVVPGEGVIGLSWAFLHAGARSIGASLWAVEDDAAALLMTTWHTRLKAGDDPVDALAAARTATARLYPHPAWWAPFVLTIRPGEWQLAP